MGGGEVGGGEMGGVETGGGEVGGDMKRRGKMHWYSFAAAITHTYAAYSVVLQIKCAELSQPVKIKRQTSTLQGGAWKEGRFTVMCPTFEGPQ